MKPSRDVFQKTPGTIRRRSGSNIPRVATVVLLVSVWSILFERHDDASTRLSANAFTAGFCMNRRSFVEKFRSKSTMNRRSLLVVPPTMTTMRVPLKTTSRRREFALYDTPEMLLDTAEVQFNATESLSKINGFDHVNPSLETAEISAATKSKNGVEISSPLDTAAATKSKNGIEIAPLIDTLDIDSQDKNGVDLTQQVDKTNEKLQPESSLSGDHVNISIPIMEEPRPTANGGYTHTSQSKAKISAANKGKTPWNKGKKRSEEVRARIAAGVRARNRERFLKKLQDMGVTEEEYEAEQETKREKKRAEREARRTEKGGYRPTEETKQKISRILKEKYATGQVKKRQIDPSKVRRGFTHTPETRAKIAASMRKRWANDPAYRDRMIESATKCSGDASVRQKISETLRKKWEDPVFREAMMTKMAANRKPRESGGVTLNAEHRQKISAALKAKWQDETYRKKTLEGINKRKQVASTVKKKRPVQKKVVKKKKVAPKRQRPRAATGASATTTAPSITPVSPRLVRPRGSSGAVGPKTPKSPIAAVARPRLTPKRPSKQSTVAAVRKRPNAAATVASATPRNAAATKARTPTPQQPAAAAAAKSSQPPLPVSSVRQPTRPATVGDPAVVNGATDAASSADDDTAEKAKKRTRKKKKSGSRSQMREDRRDLYDLLYGDDDDELHDESSSSSGRSTAASVFPAMGDENLDNFDPYGLDDF